MKMGFHAAGVKMLRPRYCYEAVASLPAALPTGNKKMAREKSRASGKWTENCNLHIAQSC